MKNRNRDKLVTFWINEKEKTLIENRMKSLGFFDKSHYLRSVAINSYIIELDLKPMRELSISLDKIGRNINQIVKVANANKNVNQDDLNKLILMYEDVKIKTTSTYKKLLNAKSAEWWNEEIED